MLFGLFRWSWAVALLSYQRLPSAASRLRSCSRYQRPFSWSRGQKSAANCAQSSFSGWVTNWSRQRGGFGDLLSRPGITTERYTDWSHNKLSTHPLSLAFHRATQTPQKSSERRREQLIKGDFPSSVYFPLLNCVIMQRSADLDDWWQQSSHALTEKSVDWNLLGLQLFILLLGFILHVVCVLKVKDDFKKTKQNKTKSQKTKLD